MMLIINIVGYSVIGIIFLSVVVSFIYMAKYLVEFHFKPCKHCNRYLEYKGFVEDNDGGHYLFHCPRCGSWEKIPYKDMVNEFDKDCNPNV